MTDRQPTQEQIKKFWEWCGLKEIHYGSGDVQKYDVDFPDLDLNNLFKYAVPKLPANELDFFSNNGLWTAVLWIPKDRIDPDGIHCSYREAVKATHCLSPSLALFWAIWEVINQEAK